MKNNNRIITLLAVTNVLLIVLLVLFRPKQEKKAEQEIKYTTTNNAMDTYFERRKQLFEHLPLTENDIVFLGNSLTDGCEWHELFSNCNIKNRGINGDKTTGVLQRLETITKGKPAKIFLMLGINDLGDGIEPKQLSKQYKKILKTLTTETPETKIYVQSILPYNSTMFQNPRLSQEKIIKCNEILNDFTEEFPQITYIDLHSHFADSNSELRPELTNDGLHLTYKGYALWKDIIGRYVKE